MTRLTDMVTVKEAAAIKGVPEGTVRKRIERERLPAQRVGDIWLIRRKDLARWKVRQRGELSISIVSEIPDQDE